MDNFYLFIVVVLFFLAISDLVVGVANDAVNFLNSAIGSKSAPKYVILIVASAGVFVGSVMSGGMMEVARKGIFHPDQFYFSEIMLIFLAVMITDVLLLNAFNALGLPTSTTVSLVFELLGAAVAISIAKILQNGETIIELNKYINSSKSLAIISSILISVFVGFIFGAIVQYLARLLFSFNFNKNIKYFGAVWGALSISLISYFIILKGVEGASFISKEAMEWIKDNTSMLILYGILIFSVIFQLLYWIFKINILKIIVLYGTFALAVAFAGNDLVNFIGVPLAGFKSYELYSSTPGSTPDTFLMIALSGKVQTETYMLFIAGIIMVLTLWFSKKAKAVIRTEVDLGRQGAGDERFAPSQVSRQIVRATIRVNEAVNTVLPKSVLKFIENRFKQKPSNTLSLSKDAPSFDLVRASVNLMVASSLIAFGTSLKLPLSTTYITFMVAMGTSLTDKAWGRESAVYRISGVFTVIAGWFFTALIAFIASLTIAFAIYYGGFIAIIIVLLLALYLSFKTHLVYKKREKHIAEIENNQFAYENMNTPEIYERCHENSKSVLKQVPALHNLLINSIINEDLKILKNSNKDIDELNLKAKSLKNNLPNLIEHLNEDFIDAGHYYVQMLDYLREVSHCMSYISKPAYEHVSNNHKGMINSQKDDLLLLDKEIQTFFADIILNIENKDFNHTENLLREQQTIINLIEHLRKKQVKRIKNNETGTKNSILFFNILTETKNLVLYSINFYKAERDLYYAINKA